VVARYEYDGLTRRVVKHTLSFAGTGNLVQPSYLGLLIQVPGAITVGVFLEDLPVDRQQVDQLQQERQSAASSSS
jgi:hypothetical protein